MLNSLQPTAQSFAYRARIAPLISSLRRVRPRVPFYELAAHRIPTLWALYRGLLRQAPSEDIRFRIRSLFRRNRHLTSTRATCEHLRKGHKWLEIFTQARQGDVRLQLILYRYTRLIAAKREKEAWKQILRDELAWQKRLRNRPIMTGSFVRPTLYNKPLPRLKPQPIHITGMINSRKKARDRRAEKYALLVQWREDLKLERDFEMVLVRLAEKEQLPFERVFTDDFATWERPIAQLQNSIRESFDHDAQRESTPYSPELLAQVYAARREKIANKTRERERERRGEILPRTIRRMRKSPPAHVLAKMTEEEKQLDRAARSVSEVGYVAYAKRRLGFKLKNPDAWKVENG